MVRTTKEARDVKVGDQLIEKDGALLDVVAVETLNFKTKIECASFGTSGKVLANLPMGRRIRVMTKTAEELGYSKNDIAWMNCPYGVGV